MSIRLDIAWDAPALPEAEEALRRAGEECVRAEGIDDIPVYAQVRMTDDDTIHEINREYRDTDRATDVLSFPMFDLTPGVLPESWEKYEDPGTGLVPLGDMAISLERAEQQAKEFGHSTKREVGYLTIHSVLHLLGYDHMDEGEMKRQMREREEAILAEIELTR